MKWMNCCLIAACLSFASPALAERSYDFSDTDIPTLDLPYKVTRIENTGTGFRKQFIYHVDQNFESLKKSLDSDYARGRKFGKYALMGISRSANGDTMNVVIGYKNEHYYLNIEASGSGSTFTYDSIASSYISGVFDLAAFGFRMPDGGTVPIGLAKDDGL